MKACRLLALFLVIILVLGLLSGCGLLRSIRKDMIAEETREAGAETDETEPQQDSITVHDEKRTSPESVHPRTDEVYSAYCKIVKEREAEYGVGKFSHYNTGSDYCWMYGVACVSLQDLDNNGVEELLLWENTLTNNCPNMAQIEIWSYENGAAIELYCGSPCLGGDPSGQSLEIMTSEDETMIMTGSAGGELDLEFYAIHNGRMVKVHTLKNDPDDHNVCNYDNQRITDEEAWDLVNASESLCNSCTLNTDDAVAILRKTEQVRVKLGL